MKKIGEIDADKLIAAVKPRQALYNKDDAMYYSHKKHRTKIWYDICKELFDNWEQLSAQDKVEYGHEVQRRWKGLRTCFTREIAHQKRERERAEINLPLKRRKIYEHFNQMQFLIDPDAVDVNNDANMTDYVGDDSSDDDPLENDVKTERFDDHSSALAANSKDLIIEFNRENEFQPNTYRNGTVEEKILDMIKDMKQDEIDEDKQFMLSLVPSFKKLNDKQKFEAKIGMLKVLKNVSFQEDD